MKRIFLILTVFSMVFTSCDPLEDINAEVDAQQTAIVGDVVYTLTDDDYDSLDKTYGNFNSVDEAKELIPELLFDLYPVWGKASSALVTFKRYNPIDTYSAVVYELEYAEYEPITGNTYGNFSSGGDVFDYLDATYPTPTEGDFVSLKYDYYSGSASTLTDGFAYENGEWTKFTGFTEDQYLTMGEGFPNFSSEDEANIKIPIALIDVYKYDTLSAGDIVLSMYELYIGGGDTESYTAAYVYDGETFSAYENEAEETIQFGHDGTTWVPDNTIKYTLVRNADYEYMASQLTGAEYAGLIGNLSNYGDFDYNWTDAQIQYALAIFLDYLNPSAAEGQKYILTYVIYDNGENDYQTSFIKTDGVWVLNE
ncbi:MAG: hypothetical protein ABJL44_11690 [Algibacter sp.]